MHQPNEVGSWNSYYRTRKLNFGDQTDNMIIGDAVESENMIIGDAVESENGDASTKQGTILRVMKFVL